MIMDVHSNVNPDNKLPIGVYGIAIIFILQAVWTFLVPFLNLRFVTPGPFVLVLILGVFIPIIASVGLWIRQIFGWYLTMFLVIRGLLDIVATFMWSDQMKANYFFALNSLHPLRDSIQLFLPIVTFSIFAVATIVYLNSSQIRQHFTIKGIWPLASVALIAFLSIFAIRLLVPEAYT
jgi:hypothetical protein